MTSRRHQNQASRTRATAAVLLSSIILLASVASAEPSHPARDFSESKLTTKDVLRASGGAPADTSMVGQIQSWVNDKVSSLSGLWGDRAPASEPSAAVPVTPPAAANAGAVSSGPSESQASSVGGTVGSAESAQPVAGQAGAVAARPAVHPSDDVERVEVIGVRRTPMNVAVYDLATSAKIPHLSIGEENRIHASDYALPSNLQKVMNDHVLHPFPTPDLLDSSTFNRLSAITTGMPSGALKTRDAVFSPKGRVSRVEFDKLVLKLHPELALKLKKFIPLTPDEQRFLSGLLLYQQGDQCPSAVGLFHKLSKSPGWVAEASYYLGMCSKKLGLTADLVERARRIFEAQDVYYSRKILKELPIEIPYEQSEAFGAALTKVSSNAKMTDKLEPAVLGNMAYWLTDYGASSGHYRVSLEWAKKVPATHPKALESRFIEALSEYQTGSKARALSLQEQLIEQLKGDKGRREFQALVALNVARMYFQESKFKQAHENFLQVYKDHPLWLQSLNEFGWSQLLSGDYEGAIGNMYSIQSPFFASVYKPESYVIRTIGYLKLCQYGDAYRTLSILEKEYRPVLEKMEKFTAKPGHSYYQTVRDYLVLAHAEKSKDAKESSTKDINGLPQSVVREMARHRDFTNLQKALNRAIDEREMYTHLDGQVETSLKGAQKLVTDTRKRVMALRRNLGQIAVRHDLEQHRNQWLAELDAEMNRLNSAFFQVDLFTEAKEDMVEYRKEVIGGADQHLASLKGNLEKVLASRVGQMKSELVRMLDNNELLRFEVFSGSGENIRYQVAGGEKGNRIPASVIPKSKSLQWDFDGEYWEDEIGHYRSSLKNNCPENNRHQQANIGGEKDENKSN